VPFVYTGHSLGRSKLRKLLNEGMREEDIDKKYKIDRRIEVEEQILSQADIVIASTRHEIEQQYGLYHNKGCAGLQGGAAGHRYRKVLPLLS
jgi:sucrose-phosphate synthase